MRVLIAAPRKSGNTLLRCLLAAAYGLDSVGSRDAPPGDDLSTIENWLGALPDDTVFHTDYDYSRELDALASRHRITLVAIVRHPFDSFVSTFDVAQHRRRKGKHRSEVPEQPGELSGRAIDDERVLAYLAGEFADEIAWLINWHDSGTPIVRLERLETDPAGALTELAAILGPLSTKQIARAVAVCSQANVIYSPPGYGRRMAAVPSGAWRDRLSDAHLAILRDRYVTEVSRLGYEVS